MSSISSRSTAQSYFEERRSPEKTVSTESPDSQHERGHRPNLVGASTWQSVTSPSYRFPAQHGDNDIARALTATRTHLTRTSTAVGPTAQTTLSRQDTAAAADIDDPRLNPDRPEFDFHLWVRKFVLLLKEDNIQERISGFVFKNLTISGVGNALQLQQDVLAPFMVPFRWREHFGSGQEKTILRSFNGSVQAGQMLIVLGRPGSGCSTFLKSICGELHGLNKVDGSVIEYNGIDQTTFKKEFRGEVVYNQEQEKHFPHLTVGETMEFAAAARTPQKRIHNIKRQDFSHHMASLVMTVFGLSHTRNTKVGNDYIRGVSGGERKRVSIAEMAVAGNPIAAWDNSTRGLDSATALSFVRSLRVASDLFGTTNAVAIYQASQAIYDLFDKAIVLYEGRQIYFGPTNQAKAYFEGMGWHCPARQTTGDFLTSVTNPSERKPQEGMESRVPRTPEEFEAYWLKSAECKAVLKEVDETQKEFKADETYRMFSEARHEEQAKGVRKGSPYTISIPMQIRLCTKRAYQRLWNDKTSTITTIIGQIAMGLVIASIFYGTPLTTNSFFAKGSILFFAVLLNALISISEINTLYEQRAIVEKHASFAFYHPFTEALAGIVSDIPIKLLISVCFNIILYFLGGLTYSASKFFVYFLFVFIITLTMSAVYRTIAALTKTVSQAMAVAGVMTLAIVTYTGFTIPPDYQRKWLFWIQYINPVRYAYEALLTNEVHGAQYLCANIVPVYGTGQNFICPVQGAVAGEQYVSGDDWVAASYNYTYDHIWRNLGILFAFTIGFWFIYLLGTEFNSASTSTAEFLIFRRGHVPRKVLGLSDEEETNSAKQAAAAEEQGQTAGVDVLPPQKDIFTWRDVTLDIKIKGEPRRLLDHVSGWVKPGTLTALMGVSGAGKTTLLDTLAQRMSVGVLTGDMLVNGKPLPSSFQRNTGYVQQQDLHLETTTVREALQFSALLRQPKSVSKQEKFAFVENVIEMLDMKDFAEAVVGNPGEGLNVEQRKLLTIGVELAAKPDLLLFLDEPTSGLDSQSSWSICAFLRKLANNGQAVLSTIHQPSAILFQEFDRLLFLAKGGRTVYFGDIGQNSRTLLDYFENNGARKCDAEENPAEYMLEIIAGSKDKSSIDWPVVWNDSQEARGVQTELDRIHQEGQQKPVSSGDGGEFAMPLTSQIYHVTHRVFQQYWRTPSYIWGKILLGVMSALFVGFSFFKERPSPTGIQNQIFSIFMLTAIFTSLVQQIMPRFVIHRSLYEVRERPSKSYSWIAFIFANLIVEIPWQIFLGFLVWAAWYFPVFGKNQSGEVMGLMLLFSIQFFVFTSTFAQMLIAGLPDAITAGNIATLMFSMTLTFNGVLQVPSALPGFWLFMYRVSPLTYFVGGWAATGIAGKRIVCKREELAVFDPPSGTSCGNYLADYLTAAPGQLLNPEATTGCEYCSITVSDQYLANSSIYWNQRWRNFGIIFAYILFNIAASIALYYLLRVKKWSGDGGGGISAIFSKFKGVGKKAKTATTTQGQTVSEDVEKKGVGATDVNKDKNVSGSSDGTL